jgi:transposase-like protein
MAVASGVCSEIRKVKYKLATWFMDETYVRVSARWMYLFRAVDNRGQTADFYLSKTRDREAARCFLRAALANPDNRPPHVTRTFETPSAVSDCGGFRKSNDGAAGVRLKFSA